MKQTISILLCLVLAISILSFGAFANEDAIVSDGNNAILSNSADLEPTLIASNDGVKEGTNRELAKEKMEKAREQMINNRINKTQAAQDFSEKMHERVANIQNRLNENMQSKIERIQNSNLSDEQKSKMISHFEKFGNWSTSKLEKIDEIAMYKLKNFEQAKLDKLKNLSADEVEKFMKLDRETQKKIMELQKDKMKLKLSEFELKKAQKKEDLFRKREIAKAAADNFRQKYQENKDAFESDKIELKKLRDDFLKSKNDGNKSLEAAKEYVTKAIDLIIKELNMMSAKVQENDDLTAEEVTSMTEKISAKILELNTVKEKVASAQTKEELKTAVKDIDNKWKIIKNHIEMIQNKIKESKIGEVIIRSNSLETKLDKILSKMEEKGVDTTAIDAKVSDFSAKVASARDKYAQAKELIDTVMNKKLDNVSVDVSLEKKQIKELMDEAHADLNDAHVILVDIAKTLKANGESIESEEKQTSEVSVVVPVEDTSSDDVEVDNDSDNESEDNINTNNSTLSEGVV